MSKALRRLSGNAKTGILPVSVWLLYVGIAIRQVHAAAVRGFAVYYEHFSMIAVIDRTLHGNKRIKRHAFYAL